MLSLQVVLEDWDGQGTPAQFIVTPAVVAATLAHFAVNVTAWLLDADERSFTPPGLQIAQPLVARITLTEVRSGCQTFWVSHPEK